MNAFQTVGVTLLASGVALSTGCSREERAAARNNASEVAQDVREGAQSAAATTERYVEKGGALLDDASITAKIKSALIAAPGLKGLAIDVDTSANVVTLNGTVSSNEVRKEAEQIARTTEGVKEVKNNLTVKASAAAG